MKLTFAEAHRLFDYDPPTGRLTWATGGGSVRLGRKAGSLSNGRYQVRLLDGKTTLANRIVWVWMTGHPANGNLEHVNGDFTDLRWDNLQACKAERDPEHMLLMRDGLWYASICVNGNETVHGPYITSALAAHAFADLLQLFAGITV